MKIYQKILAMLLMISMIFTFAGCSKSKGAQSSKLEEIQSAGKIVLGTSADYPPYEFHKEIDGKDTIVGFDIKIAKEIAKELGVELEVKDMKFDGLLAALKTGKIDFIIAGMVPKPERKESVDFSIPYYAAEQRVLIKKEDKDKVKTKEDLKALRIGAQKTTVQEDIAKSIKGEDVKSLSKITDMVLELTNDKVDALILAQPVAKSYESSNKELYMPELSLGQEDGVAVAVDKGHEKLLEKINEKLQKLIDEGKIDTFITDATKLADQ